MNVLILGGDGYLGWPTAMDMASRGHEVTVVDNYLRRRLCVETDSAPLISSPSLELRAELFKGITGNNINVRIFDCADENLLSSLIRDIKPDVIVHYAEQPSAPYSMMGEKEARLTLKNNIDVTFNLIWAVLNHAKDAHIIKLGTMGEYGTPNIDIEEGWLEVLHKGRSQKFLYPRQAGSLYHTTKILDTDLLWFYARLYGIKVTDLMQGPVYGLSTPECDLHHDLTPNLNYDDIFGTVINRFMVQAVAGIPLTVYGKGLQTRGYLNIRDTLQCINLAANTTPANGELRIFNQFTETFSVQWIATEIASVGNELGLNVTVKSIKNPRNEQEEHYYNPAHSLLKELGLTPHPLTRDVIADTLKIIIKHKSKINPKIVMPRVEWN